MVAPATAASATFFFLSLFLSGMMREMICERAQAPGRVGTENFSQHQALHNAPRVPREPSACAQL
jgi:hypothetical protein